MAKKTESYDDATLPELLTSTKKLNAALTKLTENQLVTLLAAEIGGENRPAYATRIHQRLTRVRADRERRELLGTR